MEKGIRKSHKVTIDYLYEVVIFESLQFKIIRRGYTHWVK